MKYLFDVFNERIRELTPGSKWINLCTNQSRLLAVLSNNEFNKMKDICEYAYGYYDECSKNTMHSVIRLLKIKTNLDLKVKRKKGYMLSDEIYIM